MLKKLYLLISGVIFTLVGIMHLVRLVNHVSVDVGSCAVPFGLSYIGLPVSLLLAAWAFWLLLRKEG